MTESIGDLFKDPFEMDDDGELIEYDKLLNIGTGFVSYGDVSYDTSRTVLSLYIIRLENYIYKLFGSYGDKNKKATDRVLFIHKYLLDLKTKFRLTNDDLKEYLYKSKYANFGESAIKNTIICGQYTIFSYFIKFGLVKINEKSVENLFEGIDKDKSQPYIELIHGYRRNMETTLAFVNLQLSDIFPSDVLDIIKDFKGDFGSVKRECKRYGINLSYMRNGKRVYRKESTLRKMLSKYN